MLRNVVVLCVYISAVSSSYSIGPHLPKPEKFKDVEGCFIPELDEVIPFDQAKSSKNECLEYFCNVKSISYITCGSVAALPPCKMVEDKDKPYPECCPRNDCPPDETKPPTK